jgi:selenocysteine lyase/cysteine desulfurase
MPIDVIENKIDALVCASYKWLLGPYSIGLAYYSEAFNSGKPIEDSWLNKSNADDFTKLTAYTDSYRPGAARYSMGESSNFMLIPMLNKALDEILEWQPAGGQAYSTELIQPLLKFFKENDFFDVDADTELIIYSVSAFLHI